MTDAYAHCGLRKYKPIEELRRRMRENRVDRTVLVQHRGEFDHSYIESIVRRDPRVFAGVFLVDIESPNAVDEVTRWAERKSFRGIRMSVPTLTTHRPVWVWAAQLGLQFVVDGGSLQHATTLGRFADEFPRTAIVLTHLAGPDLKNLESHRAALDELGRRTNIHVQVSGMHALDDPPYRKLLPWISALRRTLGVNRLLYGSNYPAMKDESAYALELQLAREGRLGIPQPELQAVLNDNAVRLWFSPPPRQRELQPAR